MLLLLFYFSCFHSCIHSLKMFCFVLFLLLLFFTSLSHSLLALISLSSLSGFVLSVLFLSLSLSLSPFSFLSSCNDNFVTIFSVVLHFSVNMHLWNSYWFMSISFTIMNMIIIMFITLLATFITIIVLACFFDTYFVCTLQIWLIKSVVAHWLCFHPYFCCPGTWIITCFFLIYFMVIFSFFYAINSSFLLCTLLFVCLLNCFAYLFCLESGRLSQEVYHTVSSSTSSSSSSSSASSLSWPPLYICQRFFVLCVLFLQ